MTAPRRRRWQRWALAACAFAVVLEVVLQLGALVVASVRQRAVPAARDAVVCIGDSYTFGIGASTLLASYPEQLESLLHARGIDVGVANAGWPGQDSAYILRRLPSDLSANTRVVCVMMATNDAWSRPEEVPAAELARATHTDDAAGFTWTWRTGRLLALLTRFEFGTWTRRGNVAPEPPAATAGSARVRDELRDADAGLAMLAARGLVATDQLPALLPPCDAALQARLDDALGSLADGYPAEALQYALAIAREHAAVPQAHALLARLAHTAGDRATATRALARLDELAAAGDAAATELAATTAWALGDSDHALAAARRRVAQEPRAVFAWQVLQQAAFVRNEWPEFERAAVATLRLGARFAPEPSASIARNYARVVAPREPRLAADLLVAATMLDGDVGLTRAIVRSVGGALAWPDFAAAIAAAAPSRPGVAAALRQTLQAMLTAEPNPAWAAVLRAHLQRVGEVAAAHGARVVVVGYPFHQPEVEDAQRAAATALGATFVPVRERFDAELQRRPRSDLFVSDGHCNDAGYALIAELAAAAVAPLLAR